MTREEKIIAAEMLRSTTKTKTMDKDTSAAIEREIQEQREKRERRVRHAVNPRY